MPTAGLITNHPGMLGAYGVPVQPTDFVGTGGKVFWVGNRSGLPVGNGSKPEYPLSTINAALGKCASGRGDIVYILPGHAETIGNDGDAWSNIVASTKIIGLGTGTDRPAFTFNHANAQLDIDVANVRIQNCQFFAAGALGSTTALTVANPFNVTAAGFQFIANEANVGVDSDQLCTDFIKLSAAADDCTIQGNVIVGQTGAAITTVVKTTGAVDRLRIMDNYITADVATAATGVLFDLSNAAIIDNLIINNVLANNTASAKYVIKPHANSTGFVNWNTYYTGDGATAPASSAWSTYTTNYKFGINYCVTAVSASAIISPAVDS